MNDDSLAINIFNRNFGKYKDFASFWIWYPDLALDMLKPPKGGMTLDLDQRVFLRSAVRFIALYGSLPRGYGKTLLEVLANVMVAIRYPNIRLSMTAQTKENAAAILEDKWNEITRFYPVLINEVDGKPRFSKNDAEIKFKNGAIIDVLANAQSTKGQRRHRLSIEESALVDKQVFDDALKPVVEVPRRTTGEHPTVNPEELNQQINFYTTPSYRGSDEYVRTLQMVRDMIDLKGSMVIGSDWKLACWYGRGSTKQQIMQIKKDMSPTAFAKNYGGEWTGATDGAVVSINKLMDCRNLTKPLLETANMDDEYYIGVDVARSQNSSNNQSSVIVAKVNRDATERIKTIDIVNLFNVPSVANFSSLAYYIKKTAMDFNARAIVVDTNGLGIGLADELLKETIDPNTGKVLECWASINTTNKAEKEDAPKKLYELKAQGYQSRIITTFIDMVLSKKLRLLEMKDVTRINVGDKTDYDLKVMPYVQTDLLFEEISNLKIAHTSRGGISVEQVVSKLDKDRFSALVYVLWYINEYCDNLEAEDDIDVAAITALARRPRIVR